MLFHHKLASKIFTKETLQERLQLWELETKKVVFTNGCFDILHRGHVEYLCQAKDLGEVLIVGLNTDESVKRLGKAPERPINKEDARALILAGLECVDAIVLFNENTPYELIDFIKPDVLVKGNEYKPEDIVGYHIVKNKGGQVITINMVEGFSTTSLIHKIKS